MTNVWVNGKRSAVQLCRRAQVRDLNGGNVARLSPLKSTPVFGSQRSYGGLNQVPDRSANCCRHALSSLQIRRSFTTVSALLARRAGSRSSRPFDHAVHSDDIHYEEVQQSGRTVQRKGPAVFIPTDAIVHVQLLQNQPFPESQITAIFGKGSGIESEDGNDIISIMQERRVMGSLAEEGLSPPRGGEWPRSAAASALEWLRANHAMDEEAATAQWAEAEAQRLQQEIYVERGERLGLIKRVDKHQEGQIQSAQDTVGDMYGRGALQELREHNERLLEEEERKRDEATNVQPSEQGVTSDLSGAEKQELERQQEESRLLRERESKSAVSKASSAKAGSRRLNAPSRSLREDSETMQVGETSGKSVRVLRWLKEGEVSSRTEPPQMTKLARLAPSSVVAVLSIASCILFATYYQPPTASERLFPSLPTAVATCLFLVALNVAVFALWKVPPWWRELNKYFTLAPGYPYALSVIGNIFSHQEFLHMAVNMLVLTSVGVQLHELVGRGNFLALYAASGIFGTWFSLTAYVAQGVLYTTTLGASGCVYGIVGALAILQPNHTFTVNVPVLDWKWDIWTIPLLAFFFLVSITGVITKRGQLDHLSHLGGLTAGAVGAQALQWRMAERAKRAEEMRRQGLPGGTVPWRQRATTKAIIEGDGNK